MFFPICVILIDLIISLERKSDDFLEGTIRSRRPIQPTVKDCGLPVWNLGPLCIYRDLVNRYNFFRSYSCFKMNRLKKFAIDLTLKS